MEAFRRHSARSRNDRKAPWTAREERAERDARTRSAVEQSLARPEALLERPQRPALVGSQLLERRALGVERADVPDLGRPVVILLEPPQGEPLRAAHVGPLRVDAARAGRVEKRACTFCVRDPVREQVFVMTLDHRGFEGEDGEPVRAAVVAPGTAAKPFAVTDDDRPDELVDDVMDALRPVYDVARYSGLLHGFRHRREAGR